MRRIGGWSWVAGILILGGCKPKVSEVSVQFEGRAAFGAFYADTRAVTEICPTCHQTISRGDARCPNQKDGKPCREKLRHPDRVTCGFCGGSKKCDPCAAFGTAGHCRYCAGTGQLGPSEPCFNCNRSGLCAACGGNDVCDACGGAGEVRLPWSRRDQPVLSPRTPSTSAPRETQQEVYVAWTGERVGWSSARPAPAAGWIVYRAEKGQRLEVGRQPASDPRYLAVYPGSYVAIGGNVKVYFEVLQLTLSSRRAGAIGSGTPMRGSFEIAPAVRSVSGLWELKDPAGTVSVHPGLEVSIMPGAKGHYELWPRPEFPGLAPRRGPKPLAFTVTELRVVPPKPGPVPAAVPLAFKAQADPALPEGAAYEWSVSGPDGEGVISTTGPAAQISLPRAGKYRIKVSSGPCVSAVSEIVAYGVSIVDAEGRDLGQISLSRGEKFFDAQDRLEEDFVSRSPERFRIVVSDDSPGDAKMLTVISRGRDGSVLKGPISYALLGEGSERSTRDLLFVGDTFDDRVPVRGTPDNGPDDPTLFGQVGGSVEVSYRNAPALTASIGPVSVDEIPVRFIIPIGQVASGGDLPRILDARLEQVNAVWERFGFKFRRESVARLDAPRNLLLISGRAAGVHARGGPGQVGVQINGKPYTLPTVWKDNENKPMTPALTAARLRRHLGDEWKVDIFEKLFSVDREAVVVRLELKDGRSVVVEPTPKSEFADVAQTLLPLQPNLAEGCQVASRAATLTVDEISLIFGLKRVSSTGIDIIVVDNPMSMDKPVFYKIYPESIFLSPSVNRCCIVSWAILNESGDYPYAFARALGELLRPPQLKPGESHSIFSGFSEKGAADAYKRVGLEMGTRIAEQARKVAAPK